MIPVLRHLLVLMVVYIICRYRFLLLLTLFYHRNRDCKAAPDFLCSERDAGIMNYTYLRMSRYLYVSIYVYTYILMLLHIYVVIYVLIYGYMDLFTYGGGRPKT